MKGLEEPSESKEDGSLFEYSRSATLGIGLENSKEIIGGKLLSSMQKTAQVAKILWDENMPVVEEAHHEDVPSPPYDRIKVQQI